MSVLIRDVTIINEGRSFMGSVWVKDDRIEEIYPSGVPLPSVKEVIDATGKWLIPGVIDDQVHFREPGAPQKGSLASESAAAIAGGVTSYMDMPNNQPPCCSIPLLNDKVQRAAATSYANYAFYLGADKENIEEIKSVNPTQVPGIKIFMGSSTGNMLIENEEVLNAIFRDAPVKIAVHCEEEAIIAQNIKEAKAIYGNQIPPELHPIIRSREACLTSTQKAISLALKHQSRLHILHITTKEEIELLTQVRETSSKITGEVCVHHLYFTDHDYAVYGNRIKCNPAIKSEQDRNALRDAIKKGVIQVVATDHAPHTLEEKGLPYLQTPSGLPLIQQSLPLMFGMALEGCFTLEEVVSCMCHGPAELFGVAERGFIRKGYYADLVLIDANTPLQSPLYYQCGWSPLSRIHLPVAITHTFVNGRLAYTAKRGLNSQRKVMPLKFIQ